MRTIALTGAQHSNFESDVADFVPLTADQVEAVKASNPSTSPWWVVAAQVVMGGLLVGLAWVIFGDQAAMSVACGVCAVVVPAALFARGVTSEFAVVNPGAAVLSFFVWEFVKIVVTVGMLFAAHRLVRDLSWPAMLLGFGITMKVYWLALAFRRGTKPVQLINA
jgi:ATP synthase protein I